VTTTVSSTPPPFPSPASTQVSPRTPASTRRPDPLPAPPALTATAVECLTQARRALVEAGATTEHTRRYACAHVAALRAAAAVLAVRARPHPRGQRNAWVLLTRVAPELEEWAAFFAAGAAKRSAAEAGLARAVTTREADDLLRDAECFCDVVEQVLGVASQPLLPGPLPVAHGPADRQAG
jgi:hypothetical protein